MFFALSRIVSRYTIKNKIHMKFQNLMCYIRYQNLMHNFFYLEKKDFDIRKPTPCLTAHEKLVTLDN